MQATLIILETYGIEYFKIVFLNNYNCVYKTPFANPVTYMIEHDQSFIIPIICTVQLTMYSIAIQLVILDVSN